MSSNAALESKISKISKFFKVSTRKKKVSVVRYREGEPIEYPDNVADNILLVPYQCDSDEEWERQAMANAAQRDDT